MNTTLKIIGRKKSKILINIIIMLTALLVLKMSLTAQDQIPPDQVINVFRGENNNNRWIYFSDSQNSLYKYYAGKSCSLLDKRSEEISKMSGKQDWERRQVKIRDTFDRIIGPFPEKTPLNPQVVRVVQKEEFRVEHIIFESQLDYFVTSSLFIPNNLDGKTPAVVYVPGHTENYRDSIYQLLILNLVHRGFIVYAFDPVSLGERVQYFDIESGKSSVGIATSEHSYAGAQSLLTGISQARNMIWDGIRAVDYLCTREEVDTKRIGMVGNSGGGTQTAYMSAFDDRIYAAIPSNFITNLKRLLQSIGPQDAEQNIYGIISNGLDHADFITARAPKPVLILSSTRDFFSIQGTFETIDELKKVYRSFDKPGNLQFFNDDVTHSVTKAKREKIYSFFMEHLSLPGDPAEFPVESLNPEELKITSTGQVATSLKGVNIFSVNKKVAENLTAKLNAAREHPETHIRNALKSARELAGYEDPLLNNKPVFTGRINFDGYSVEKYFIKTENSYAIPYMLVKPAQSSERAVIYIHPDGKKSFFSNREEIEYLSEKGVTVLLPDLPGIGENGPENKRQYTHRTELFASSLLSKSVAGSQAADVVRLALLMKNQPGIREVFGIAHNYLSAVMLHAASFEPALKGILLNKPCISYHSVASTEFYSPEFTGSIVPYALTKYDLLDLAASLAPRKLIMLDIVNGANQKLDTEGSIFETNFIRSVYKKTGASDNVMFLSKTGSSLTGEILDKLF
jgi:dienelactone hydrolase